MINYQTILSSFDNKLTLMQWLNKVEDALRNGSLNSVSLTQPTTDTAVFVFNFADGSSLSSPSLSLPAGPQGPQGPAGEDGEDGTSVRILANAVSCTQLGDGYIDANGHLQVLTSLSPRTFTDVGEIKGPQGDTGVGVQNVAINASNHLITTLTDNTTIDAGEIETLQGPTGPQGPQGNAGENGNDGVSVTNVQVTNTNHLIVTLSNSQTIDAGEISVSGGGGGTQLYKHELTFTRGTEVAHVRVYNTIATQYEYDNNMSFNGLIFATFNLSSTNTFFMGNELTFTHGMMFMTPVVSVNNPSEGGYFCNIENTGSAITYTFVPYATFVDTSTMIFTDVVTAL